MSDRGAVQMPLYQSHKKVWALKLGAVSDKNPDGVSTGPDFMYVTPEDARFSGFDAMVKDRPKPGVGWYYVVYEDGYTSFSPAEAFEDGYTLIA